MPATTLSLTGPNIEDKVFLLNLRLGSLSVRRKVENSAFEVVREDDDPETDTEMLSHSKKILDCEEVDKIRKLHGAIRKTVESQELRCTGQFRAGMYLMPYALLEKVEAQLKAYNIELRGLVEALLANYQTRINESAEKLGTLFNEDDYPKDSEIRKRLVMIYSYQTLATPEQLKKFKGDVFAREEAKLRRQMEEAIEESRQLMALDAKELLLQTVEKLTPGPDGKPKIFRNSLVTNWIEFLDTFEARNVTGDEDFADLISQVRSKIAGREANDLRADTGLRIEIREAFAGIASQLDDMIIDKPIRRIRFADEDGDGDRREAA